MDMDANFSGAIEYIHGSKPFDCNQKEFCQLLSDIKNAKYLFEQAKTSKGSSGGRRGSSTGSQELSCDGSDDDCFVGECCQGAVTKPANDNGCKKL